MGGMGSGFRVQGSGFRVQGRGGGFAANIYVAMPKGLRYGSLMPPSHSSLIPAFKFCVVYVIYLFKASIAAAASIVTPKGRIDSSMAKLAL